MSNKYRTTLYIGVNADIYERIFQHKTGSGSVFTSRYKLTDLVYFEEFNFIEDAIAREKQLKRWHRDWKMNLIKEMNPDLVDLAEDWFTEDEISFHMQLLKKLK